MEKARKTINVPFKFLFFQKEKKIEKNPPKRLLAKKKIDIGHKELQTTGLMC